MLVEFKHGKKCHFCHYLRSHEKGCFEISKYTEITLWGNKIGSSISRRLTKNLRSNIFSDFRMQMSLHFERIERRRPTGRVEVARFFSRKILVTESVLAFPRRVTKAKKTGLLQSFSLL